MCLAAELFAICSWQPSDSVGVWVNVGSKKLVLGIWECLCELLFWICASVGVHWHASTQACIQGVGCPPGLMPVDFIFVPLKSPIKKDLLPGHLFGRLFTEVKRTCTRA